MSLLKKSKKCFWCYKEIPKEQVPAVIKLNYKYGTFEKELCYECAIELEVDGTAKWEDEKI